MGSRKKNFEHTVKKIKRIIYNPQHYASTETYLAHIKQAIENLEKELRKLLDTYEKGGSLPYFVSDFIREILGEEGGNTE